MVLLSASEKQRGVSRSYRLGGNRFYKGMSPSRSPPLFALAQGAPAKNIEATACPEVKVSQRARGRDRAALA
jgi:hypothetical protein